MVISLLATGCTSTKTVSEDVERGVHELKLKAGDTIKVVTINRERYFLKINLIQRHGFEGTTLQWKDSKTSPDEVIFVDYSDLALIQEEHFSSGATAGAVATITIVGAMVAAVAVGGPVVMPPP